jgi:CrcB protein
VPAHSSEAEQVVDGKRFSRIDPGPAPRSGNRPTADNGVLPIDPDQPGSRANARPSATGRRGGGLPPWRVLAAIAIGAFAGGLARYGLGLADPTGHGAFPAATFAINVSGSFVLALGMVLVLEVWPPTTYVRPVLGVGFCGAYTTFSTWMLGTDQLVSSHHVATAAWYLAASLLAGLAATSLGLSAGRAVVAHRKRAEQRAAGLEEARA